MVNKEAKDGSLRLMTQGELKMAKEIFRDTIIYSKVWIHKGSYFYFGLQNKNTSMAPNGEMYFRNYYSQDFSKAIISTQHIFIHELSHVWQYQHGMNVKLRGLASWAAKYQYTLSKLMVWNSRHKLLQIIFYLRVSMGVIFGMTIEHAQTAMIYPIKNYCASIKTR